MLYLDKTSLLPLCFEVEDPERFPISPVPSIDLPFSPLVLHFFDRFPAEVMAHATGVAPQGVHEGTQGNSADILASAGRGIDFVDRDRRCSVKLAFSGNRPLADAEWQRPRSLFR